MATLPALQDTDDEGAEAQGQPDPNEAAEGEGTPDGGNPEHMIGYIDPNLSAKVKTFLEAAKGFLISGNGAAMLKKVLGQSGDHVQALALLVGKTVEMLQNKLGPLDDKEHDQVCFFIAGWLVSSCQQMGMPGLDDAGARQDLIGRILQALEQGGQSAQQEGAEPPNAAPEAQGPPAPPDAQQGTMPQLGGP